MIYLVEMVLLDNEISNNEIWWYTLNLNADKQKEHEVLWSGNGIKREKKVFIDLLLSLWFILSDEYGSLGFIKIQVSFK